MAEQVFSASSELVDWINQNRDELKKRVVFLQHLSSPEGRARTMKQIVTSPNLLSEAWSEVVRAMENMGAPDGIRSEAKQMAAALDESIKQKQTSETDQRELTQLIDNIQTTRSGQELGEIVQQAVKQGNLSETLGQRIIQYTQEVQRAERSAGTTLPSARWNWGACGFCGALALPAGPEASVVACILCALAAE
jgi:Tfp pilus assembly protein PilP